MTDRTGPGGAAPRAAQRELADALARALATARIEPDRAAVGIRASEDGVTITIGQLPTSAGGPVPVAHSFASWFAGMLADEGMSQEEAARRIGVSVRAVGRWVRSESEPRYQELVRLCRTFGRMPPLLGMDADARSGEDADRRRA